jgi:uncharacterized protein (DUF1330 family)
MIANLTETRPGPEAAQYLQRIDATLAPFRGRFLVHGAPPEVLEGSWSGDTIIVEFPDAASARAWYSSDAYQAIKPYRTAQYAGAVLIIDGVPASHRAIDLLSQAA